MQSLRAGPSRLRRLGREVSSRGRGGRRQSLPSLHLSLCRAGALSPDQQQSAAIERLESVRGEVWAHWEAMRAYSEALIDWHATTRAMLARAREEELQQKGQWSLRREGTPEGPAGGTEKLQVELPPPPVAPTAPKGLFLCGDVGVGKTLVLDLEDAKALTSSKGRSQLRPPMVRRVHFNAFIAECHRRLHAHSFTQQEQKLPDQETGQSRHAGGWDIMIELVRQLVSETTAPEDKDDLGKALDVVSRSIITEAPTPPSAVASQPEGAGGTTQSHLGQSGDAALQGLEDPDGRPLGLGVLCFDEIQASCARRSPAVVMMDIADATIVNGVLRRLLDAGWVVIATCALSPHCVHPLASLPFEPHFPLLLIRMQLQPLSRATECDFDASGAPAGEKLQSSPA
ncbi:MAG: hypothetical protein SGPRY_005281 [Prymnesium sp.]